MRPFLPDPSLTRRSVKTYLRIAYEGPPPDLAISLIEQLDDADDDSYFSCTAFETGGSEGTRRWSLRLGNSRYPHMKLKIAQKPDADSYLYSVDTHDNLGLSPESPEFHEFRALMQFNKGLASEIEAAWEEIGIPTFKAWLLADLARRRDGEIR